MRSLLVPLGNRGPIYDEEVGFYQSGTAQIGVAIGDATVATFDACGLTVDSLSLSGGRPVPVVAAAAIPVALVQGELVKLAFRSDQVAFYTASVGSTAAFTIQGQFYNNDDANEIVGLIVPAGTAQGASIQFVAYGTIIGIRYQRTTSTPPFSVAIDGIAYAVPNTQYKWNGRPSIVSTTVDGDSNTIVVRDLPDGPHSVEIILASALAGGGTRTLNFYGFMAERRVGYRERHGYQNVAQQGTLTGSAVAVANNNNITGLRKIVYVNTATATSVAIANNGTLVATIPLAATGTAGDTGEFDPGDYIAYSTLLTHTSAGTVRYTAFGRR